MGPPPRVPERKCCGVSAPAIKAQALVCMGCGGVTVDDLALRLATVDEDLARAQAQLQAALLLLLDG